MTIPGIEETPADSALPEAAAPMVPERAVETPLRVQSRAFASFAYRNYRLWFTGQAASLVGTWMQTTAQGFLIFELTKSPAYLGLIGFAAGLPIWLFTLYGGVVSDRLPRRNLMVITQSAMMLLAFLLAALTFLKWVQPWMIILLAFGTGVANAFDSPARMAFVVELVDREDLGNAVALNSTMVNLGTATGPAIAGIAYALFGPAWCFTINGISFIAVIVALVMMRIKPLPVRQRSSSALKELRAGLRFTAKHPVIRVLILFVSLSVVFGLAFSILMPAWAVDVLHGDSTTNGFLQSARGLGSLLGALMIASMGRIRIKGKVLTLGSFAFPILVLVWSALRWLPLSLLAMVGVGWALMLVLNMTNILIQEHVTDELRGRVMGIYSLAFFGMMPIGALLAGSVAVAIGAPLTVALGALVTLGFAAFLWLRMPGLRALE